MTSEDKSAFSSLSPQDQRGTDRLQNNQMEDTIKYLRDHGYKVTEEYSNTGLSTVSGEHPPRKTWWDWLQVFIVPIVLLLIGTWFSYQQNQTNLKISLAQRESDQQITLDQQHQTTLKTSIDDMKDLLLNRSLKASKSTDGVRVVARGEVLIALRQLDGGRKGLLIQFLSEAGLITGEGNDVIIALNNADLNGAYLGGAGLNGAYLRSANLRNADLNNAHLSHADLTGADLDGTDLRNADLSGANLSSALNFTQQQLDQVSTCKGAILPILPKELKCYHNQ